MSRKGAVSVRVNCAGDAGAVCRGTVKLVRGKTTLGTQGVRHQGRQDRDGQGQLRKSARKATKATVVVRGKDSAGAALNVRHR